MYVPYKTVYRGNFTKYIDRVYTIIRDSRVITCYVQSHDVRFVFTLCLSKMRFIKLILKGKEIGEYKSLYVSSCRISLMTQFPSNSHANLTAKRREEISFSQFL